MLRLWVRLHARPMPPGVDDVAREVHTYALPACRSSEPSMALAGAGERKGWGIIEID